MRNKIILPLLETERLFLVPWSLEFAKDMLAYESNPNVTIPSETKTMKTLQQAERNIEKLIHDNRMEWAIVYKEDFFSKNLKAIGSIGISPANKNSEHCFDGHYLLAEEYWGRGICTEALKKVVHYAFIGLKAESFWMSPRRYNEKSRHVIEKCGFIYEDYSPHTKPNSPDNVILYKLTRSEFNRINNYSDSLYEQDLYRINYITEDTNNYVDSITYRQQPNEYQCGQSTVAMLAGVTPEEVANVMYEEYGTQDCDMEQALNYYKIPHDVIRKPYFKEMILPDICILSMQLPGYGHWSLYYKGKYYDPEFGVLDACPERTEICYYWEIYNDFSSMHRSSFYLRGRKPISPYNKDNPVRIIDSINYVNDSTKCYCETSSHISIGQYHKQAYDMQGCYCGQACIAMLTGVPFEEVIELMREDEHAVSKKVLKKWLDYYGIRYKATSDKFDSDAELPELCIIRMNLESGGGHWGIYYKGKYYDPYFGLLDECPQQAEIFQVLEIYPW